MSGIEGIETILAHSLLELDLGPPGEDVHTTPAQTELAHAAVPPATSTHSMPQSPEVTPMLGQSADVPGSTAAHAIDTSTPTTVGEAARSETPHSSPVETLPSASQPASSPSPDAPLLHVPVQLDHLAAAAEAVYPAALPSGTTTSADTDPLASRRTDLASHAQAAVQHLHGAAALGSVLPTLILPQTVILQTGRPPRDAPILRRAPARQPTMRLEPFDVSGQIGRRISYTDCRPVPIDIAPHRAQARCWRLDDTEALILAGNDDQEASRHVIALHARLLDGGAPFTLHEGEGFSTWEGSPLWLALAGIPKPAALGVLLSETNPSRLTLLRLPRHQWLVERSDGTSRILETTSSHVPSPLELDDAVCEATRTPAVFDPTSLRRAEAHAALDRFAARLTHLPDAEAAVARAICRAATATATTREFGTRDDLLAAARADDASLPVRLLGFGRTVLETLSGGSFDGIDKIAGLALAGVLGRLQNTSAMLQEDR